MQAVIFIGIQACGKSTFYHCPHPQPFSLREKGAGFKVPLPQGEGFRVRVKKRDTPVR